MKRLKYALFTSCFCFREKLQCWTMHLNRTPFYTIYKSGENLLLISDIYNMLPTHYPFIIQ